MGHIRTGLERLLGHPDLFQWLQGILGSDNLYKTFVRVYVCPFDGAEVLDLGCGVGALWPYLDRTRYVGLDISAAYIRAAQKRYGDKAVFIQGDAGCFDARERKFDIVTACSVLHHLDDDSAKKVIQVACQALKPKGRFVTLDPCLTPSSPFTAWWARFGDRGQHIRDSQGYIDLIRTQFEATRCEIHPKLVLLPVAHCITVSVV